MKDMAERFTYDIAISIVPHWECQTSTRVGALGMDGIGSSARHAWRPISPSLNFVTFSFAEMLCIRRSQSSISFKRKVNEYRMYDPVMSSFLSVDNYVQSPENSQNFNRYAYCLNNPLKYTDPSGELGVEAMIGISAAIGATINVVTNGFNNMKNGESFFSGAGKAAVMGALQGVVSFAIGESSGVMDVVFKNELTADLAKAGFQMLAHGTLGGVSTQSRGGNFWHGFVSSATASVICSAVGITCKYHEVPKIWTMTAMVAAGGISGGVTASMAGGDFWDGLCNGLICAGLNHAMHEITQLPVRQRTKQFRINKIGRLPLDSDTNGLTYGAMQTANYKMLYNVTAADVPLLDSEGNYIGTHRVLTISASSYNTLVEGDVHAYANATIIADGQVIASSPLQMESGGTLPIMQEGYTYVGDVSFEIPCTANVSLQIEGGWNVFMGSGWCVPSMGLPINADMFIPIFHHD